MRTIKKHHLEHLDGTKGAWRPAHVPGLVGVDGLPASFNEVVVFTCPQCGAPQGVGGDRVKIQVDGTTNDVVPCVNAPRCAFNDVVKFENHGDDAGREHFARLKEEAHSGVAETRIRRVKEKVRERMLAEIDAKAHEEAKRVLPDGDPNHPELFKDFMKGQEG